jgi:hypothetical protein
LAKPVAVEDPCQSLVIRIRIRVKKGHDIRISTPKKPQQKTRAHQLAAVSQPPHNPKVLNPPKELDMAKAKNAVPAGFRTVTPQLTLDNAAQTIDWYKESARRRRSLARNRAGRKGHARRNSRRRLGHHGE